MEVINLKKEGEDKAVKEAVLVLRKGGSVVYPTDTVYGLAVNSFDDFAVRRLFRIKKRAASKPVALIVSSIAMAKKLAYIDSDKEKILRALWPGAVSVVLHKKSLVSSYISAGTETVSLRLPDNDFCIKLIKTFDGPITSTSANISGEKHTNNIWKIVKRFENEFYKPDVIINVGTLSRVKPSTVLDLTKPKPKITRVGPASPKDLSRILGTSIDS